MQHHSFHITLIKVKENCKGKKNQTLQNMIKCISRNISYFLTVESNNYIYMKIKKYGLYVKRKIITGFIK